MQDKHKTMVIFRVWRPSWYRSKETDCIAMFPVWKERGFCQSYEHIGQHGFADYNNVLSRTRKATPEEAIDLADELKDIGYHLSVRQRRPSYSYEKKWREMGNS